MRVLICRAGDAARRTARHVEAAGHGAVLAPVTRVLAIEAPPPPGRFDAVMATSAHAFDAPGLAALLRLPAFAVGKATGEAARRHGFLDIRTSAGDASALADLARLTLRAPARLLYLAGRDRKPTTEQALGAAGYEVATLVRYEAVAVEAWDEAAVAALRGGDLDAALHFSRRSADLALGLARRHAALAAFLALDHACLSEDVATPLRAAGARAVGVAEAPDEAGLLRLLPGAGR